MRSSAPLSHPELPSARHGELAQFTTPAELEVLLSRAGPTDRWAYVAFAPLEALTPTMIASYLHADMPGDVACGLTTLATRLATAVVRRDDLSDAVVRLALPRVSTNPSDPGTYGAAALSALTALAEEERIPRTPAIQEAMTRALASWIAMWQRTQELPILLQFLIGPLAFDVAKDAGPKDPVWDLLIPVATGPSSMLGVYWGIDLLRAMEATAGEASGSFVAALAASPEAYTALSTILNHPRSADTAAVGAAIAAHMSHGGHLLLPLWNRAPRPFDAGHAALFGDPEVAGQILLAHAGNDHPVDLSLIAAALQSSEDEERLAALRALASLTTPAGPAPPRAPADAAPPQART